MLWSGLWTNSSSPSRPNHPFIEKNMKINASRIVEKVKEIHAEQSLNEVTIDVVEGADARHVICEPVEKYNATMLVLGSHGHGRLKRVVLGSVSHSVHNTLTALH
ncbi:hypothetical protein Sjap_006851 [Stephania japonica]|uniref:UspA domain-containing protein n=1 Tax=Stephania japonica TaxID=461633 RepID=A0AAP0PJC2_9MAGN